jgi:protein-L-isoaspartate(D-aspartate) O-methyltransferase
MDYAAYGGHGLYVWTREHLEQVVLAGKSPLITNPELIKAFKTIDRADFLPEQLQPEAYTDKDLEFAFGEKINSPVLVAQMLQSLNLKPGQKVLELGTGAGYSTALIALTVGDTGQIFSLERNQQIMAIARKNLQGYSQIRNVELIFKDGATGLDVKSPYDAIHVTFAYDNIPEDLLLQLKIGGRLVAPLTNLEIKLYTRISEDEFSSSLITAKQFAKMQHGVE